MCTALNDVSGRHLFGRTLDLEYTLDETVVISPEHLPFSFIHEGKCEHHPAIVGVAHVHDETPLYYDAMNKDGLGAAALRFPELCVYHEKKAGSHNVASFELIPWLLCNFRSAREAAKALARVNITPDSVSPELPATPLHWIIADKDASFVVESVKDGITVYENPYGVLTNAPDFPSQCKALKDQGDSIPGDLSSQSRFIRIANAAKYTMPSDDTDGGISRFFHILGTVNQPDGLFRQDERRLRTVYTSCMDTKNSVYYFTTYASRQIRAVKLKDEYLPLTSPIAFPTSQKENIEHLN